MRLRREISCRATKPQDRQQYYSNGRANKGALSTHYRLLRKLQVGAGNKWLGWRPVISGRKRFTNLLCAVSLQRRAFDMSIGRSSPIMGKANSKFNRLTDKRPIQLHSMKSMERTHWNSCYSLRSGLFSRHHYA